MKFNGNTHSISKIPLCGLRNIKPVWILNVENWIGFKTKLLIQSTSSPEIEDATKIRLALTQKCSPELRAKALEHVWSSLGGSITGVLHKS